MFRAAGRVTFPAETNSTPPTEVCLIQRRSHALFTAALSLLLGCQAGPTLQELPLAQREERQRRARARQWAKAVAEARAGRPPVPSSPLSPPKARTYPELLRLAARRVLVAKEALLSVRFASGRSAGDRVRSGLSQALRDLRRVSAGERLHSSEFVAEGGFGVTHLLWLDWVSGHQLPGGGYRIACPYAWPEEDDFTRSAGAEARAAEARAAALEAAATR